MSELGPSHVPNSRPEAVESGVAAILTEIQGQILTALAEHTEPLGFLDSLSQPEQQLTVAALADLPVETILELFGRPTLAWVYLSSTNRETRESLARSLRDSANFNTKLLDRTAIWTQARVRNSTRCDSIRQYEFAELIMGDTLAGLDISKALLTSAREGVKISPKRLASYELKPIALTYDSYWEDANQQAYYPIHMDSPAGFVLTYKGKPQAVLGLSLSGNKELMIVQIQGIRGIKTVSKNGGFSQTKIPSRGLAPFNWTELMVRIAEETARTMGIQQLGIQGARKNHWYRLNNRKRLRAIYNKTAKNMGFKRGSDGNWHKEVA